MNDPALITGLYNGAAPQDWASEVAPVERELQRIDSGLRIVWNPKAFLARVGMYDATGRAVPPIYEGRWQVVIQGKTDGVDTIIYTLGSEDGTRKPYKPVGPWLVDYMRAWDTANVHRMEAMKKLLQEQEAVERALAIDAQERRREASECFSTDVLGLKPIRSVIPTQIQ